MTAKILQKGLEENMEMFDKVLKTSVEISHFLELQLAQEISSSFENKFLTNLKQN